MTMCTTSQLMCAIWMVYILPQTPRGDVMLQVFKITMRLLMTQEACLTSAIDAEPPAAMPRMKYSAVPDKFWLRIFELWQRTPPNPLRQVFPQGTENVPDMLFTRPWPCSNGKWTMTVKVQSLWGDSRVCLPGITFNHEKNPERVLQQMSDRKRREVVSAHDNKKSIFRLMVFEVILPERYEEDIVHEEFQSNNAIPEMQHQHIRSHVAYCYTLIKLLHKLLISTSDMKSGLY